MQIRRIRRDEGSALRELRLRALLESPDAFESRYRASSQQPDSHWADWARRAASGDEECLFVAEAETELIGLIGAFTVSGRPNNRHVIAMWVDPGHRHHGIGTELIRTVVEWCRACGVGTAGLWVIDGNDGARRLYEREGFRSTGRTQPVKTNPGLTEELMVLDLVVLP